jgi:LysM repeat protein
MPIQNLTLGLCALLLAGSALAQGSAYRVRNGDFDWAIAKRHNITVSQLHKLNPGVDWDDLKIGLLIRVPGSHESSHRSKLAALHHTSGSHVHKVSDGENDWIIAHRAGTTVTVLRELNPGVRLALLHPGEKIRLPGRVSEDSPVAHHIRSTRVAVNGDNVTIRQGPGTEHDSICTVDSGLHAAVLDRNGDWYQLRFSTTRPATMRRSIPTPTIRTRFFGGLKA